LPRPASWRRRNAVTPVRGLDPGAQVETAALISGAVCGRTPPPPRFARSPSPAPNVGEEEVVVIILPCEAGEGDRANRGGGGRRGDSTSATLALTA